MSIMSSVSGGLHSFGGGVSKISKRVVAEAVSTISLIAVSGYSILASGASGSMPQTPGVTPLAYTGLGLGVCTFLDNAVRASREDATADSTLGMMSGAAMFATGLSLANGASPEVAISFAAITAGIEAAKILARLKKDSPENKNYRY